MREAVAHVPAGHVPRRRAWMIDPMKTDLRTIIINHLLS